MSNGEARNTLLDVSRLRNFIVRVNPDRMNVLKSLLNLSNTNNQRVLTTAEVLLKGFRRIQLETPIS